jgi:hypothetical protein
LPGEIANNWHDITSPQPALSLPMLDQERLGQRMTAGKKAAHTRKWRAAYRNAAAVRSGARAADDVERAAQATAI